MHGGGGRCTGFSFAFVRNFLKTVWYMISYISYALWVLYLEFQTIPMYVRSISFGWMTFGFYLFLKNGPAFCFMFVKELLVWDWFDSRIEIFGVDSYAIERVDGYHRIENDRFFKTFRTVLSAVVPNSSVTFPLSFSQKKLLQGHIRTQSWYNIVEFSVWKINHQGHWIDILH